MSTLTVVPIETPSLGDRTYVVHDGEVALVVDPQRDIDRVLDLLDDHGVAPDPRLRDPYPQRLRHRGTRPRAGTGAAYLVNGEDDVSFERTPLADGQVVEVGDRMRVTAIATPGHTFTHLSYRLGDGDEQVAVFSGGSLLYGATGRPDLLGEEHTDELVRHQHASAHRLADLLPDEAEVYPTHGFGSFCSATQSEATSSTIGRERRANPVLTQDEQTYSTSFWPGSVRGRPTTPTWLRPTPAGPRNPTCRCRPSPTPPSCGAASRRVSGWSTCAPARRSPPAMPPGR